MKNSSDTSHEILLDVLDSLDAIVYVADIHTNELLYLNEYSRNIFGSNVGKPCWQVLQKDQAGPCDFCSNNKLISSNGDIKETYVWEHQNTLNDRWYEMRDRASKWIDGRLVKIQVATDITDKMRFEEALRKSEALLKDTGQMAKVGGWELDAKTLELSWTEGTYHIYELPIGHMPSLEEATHFFHPDDRPRLEVAIQKALEHGEPYDMETRFVTAKGKQLWTQAICKPVVLAGKIIKLTGTFQDITERKLAEQAIANSERRLSDILMGPRVYTWGSMKNAETN